MPQRKAPAWTQQEIAILHDVYPREGINGVTDLLPERSWQAIYVMANKRGLRSSVVTDAPAPILAGEQLEEAIRLREEQGWSFARIGATFGISEAGASNAILIALCPRKGFRPAERDEKGRLTAQGLERLRLALRRGMKAVDIQLQLGLSAGRVAEERRRYSADLKARGKAPLPPAGGGAAYSGAKLTRQQRAEVEALLLQGFGAKIVTERTSASNTTVGRIRNRLVKKLARKGETLPGCDRDGRRIAAAMQSRHYIPAASLDELRRRILAREPVARAAQDLGIGGSTAYRLRDEIAAELAARGEQLLPPIRLGRSSEARSRSKAAQWLPADRRQEYRNLAHEHGHAVAKDIMLARIAEERRAEASRPRTFEEQLARVAAGKATIAPVFRPSRVLPDATLGGVATGMIGG